MINLADTDWSRMGVRNDNNGRMDTRRCIHDQTGHLPGVSMINPVKPSPVFTGV